MSSLTSTCHCKAFIQNIDISNVELPHVDTTCSCTSCRRRTGQLAIFPFPHPSITFPDSLSTLKHYDTLNTTTGRTVRTYFCGTCGSKIHIQIRQQDDSIVGGGWMLGCLVTMMVDDKPLIKVHGHSFVEDTVDGGVSAFWKKAGGEDLVVYKEESTDVGYDRKEDRELHLHCRCGGFDVSVTRPDDSTRFRASWCACDSCRIVAGSDLPAFPWIEVPLDKIHSGDDRQVWIEAQSESPPKIPGLTLYHSTPSKPNIGRYFCSTCGATVAFLDTKRESRTVDLAYGLVDAVEGSLAVKWGEWAVNIGIKEDGLKRWGKLIDEFENGLIAWRTRESL